MQIGEVIRKYRKEKNMTQEEMAKRLGVTAPAVNKWENGNSLPDIMLLAPIARLLDISLDTLLSFRGELTEEEANRLLNELRDKLKSETYEEAFQWAKRKLELYPNCEQLLLRMAQVLDGWRVMEDTSVSERYDEYICDCYVRALDSKDEDIRSSAADSLFSFYVKKEQYEKAEESLIYLSKQNPERKRRKALLYSRTNRLHEAYREYEELVFQSYTALSMTFHGIYMLAMQEKDMEKAHVMVGKQTALAKLFDMGEYYEISCRLDLATAEKDVDTTIETMKKMLGSVDKIREFQQSVLYEHMKFGEVSEEFLEELRKNLRKCFRDEETYRFLGEDERWKKIVKE